MKHRLVTAALAAACACAHATDKPPAPVAPPPLVLTDTWSGKDKRDHFAISSAIGLASGQAITEANAQPWLRAQGCGVSCQRWVACMAPGVAKEAYDARRGAAGSWSWKDMAANFLGCGLGLTVSREF